jgi:hypothetical protein
MMVSRESNNTPVALEPLLQMHAMGHQSRQNRHGGGGGTSFFLVLFSPNPHILSDRQTIKSCDLNVYDTKLQYQKENNVAMHVVRHVAV